MLVLKRILGGIAIGLLLVVAACGQKGDLVLPTEPASQNRATLPQVLRPTGAATPAPAASAPAPVR